MHGTTHRSFKKWITSGLTAASTADLDGDGQVTRGELLLEIR
jgi:hypothetical protein